MSVLFCGEFVANKHPDNDDFLKQYRQQRDLYDDYAATLASLVNRTLRESGINIHSVTYRVKSLESLSKKIGQAGRSYGALPDVTDLAGIRVTTYFHDDVDKAAKIIEGEFAIDRDNSVDKRELLDPDRFGYISVHYIVELLPSRALLPEYKRFQGLNAELQVRSLLQHTWAEIEHDLGYKSAQSVPVSIRRRFARLAGLLELADAEFVAIRDDLATYEREVPLLIESYPEAVLLDGASLLAFIRESEVSQRVDSELMRLAHTSITDPDSLHVSLYLAGLNFVGIDTIAALDKVYKQNEQDIIAFAKVWKVWMSAPQSSLAQGVGMFFLPVVLLCKTDDKDRIGDLMRQLGIANPSGVAEQIINTAKSAI